MRPGGMVGVYSGTMSQNVRQGDINRIEGLQWCRPPGLSSNHVLTMKIKLERKVASNLQDTSDKYEINPRSQTTDYTRCSGKQMSVPAVGKDFRFMTSLISKNREELK